MRLPTKAELDKAAAAFDQDWGGVDEVLYCRCREHPSHDDRRQVTAKVALVDRAYSAGLERHVIPDPGDQAITKIGAFLVARGGEVDAILARLASLHEPLSSAAMAEIVSEHGRFTELLRQIPTRGTVPRSFAAKYLHFHNPVVPIYDSYAAAGLIKVVRWDANQVLFERPAEGDAEYWAFCVRFLRLCEACVRAGLDVTVKSLDAWLWQVPAGRA